MSHIRRLADAEQPLDMRVAGVYAVVQLICKLDKRQVSLEGSAVCRSIARRLSTMASCDVATYLLKDDGQFPNCGIQNLPVLLYKSAFSPCESPSALANKIEETFTKNGFPPQWRFGLYDYPHYHSTSHEILGVFKGSARVRSIASLQQASPCWV